MRRCYALLLDRRLTTAPAQLASVHFGSQLPPVAAGCSRSGCACSLAASGPVQAADAVLARCTVSPTPWPRTDSTHTGIRTREGAGWKPTYWQTLQCLPSFGKLPCGVRASHRMAEPEAPAQKHGKFTALTLTHRLFTQIAPGRHGRRCKCGRIESPWGTATRSASDRYSSLAAAHICHCAQKPGTQ